MNKSSPENKDAPDMRTTIRRNAGMSRLTYWVNIGVLAAISGALYDTRSVIFVVSYALISAILIMAYGFSSYKYGRTVGAVDGVNIAVRYMEEKKNVVKEELIADALEVFKNRHDIESDAEALTLIKTLLNDGVPQK